MIGRFSLSRPVFVLALVLALGMCFIGPNAVLASGSAATAESEGHGEAAAGHGGIPEKKIWDFVWRAMNFAALFAILFFLLRKPVGNFFTGRRENIAQTLADLEKKKAEAEARFKELESKLADLTDEREKIITDYIREGEEEREKIIANAHQMAERIKNQAEVTIKQEIKTAKAELVQEIADLSANMAEEMVKQNIDDQDQVRLVEDYLGKVVHN